MSWFSFFLAFLRGKNSKKNAATLNMRYSLWLHRKLWLMVASYRCYMSAYVRHLLYGFRFIFYLCLSCFCHQEEAKWRTWCGVKSKKLKLGKGISASFIRRKSVEFSFFGEIKGSWWILPAMSMSSHEFSGKTWPTGVQTFIKTQITLFKILCKVERQIRIYISILHIRWS